MAEEKNDLANEICEPANGSDLPMPMGDASKLLTSLDPGWSINGSGHLERTFLVKDFNAALKHAVLIGRVAHDAHYYPDLLLSQGVARVEIWARSINGLSRADFVLAAKIDSALKNMREPGDV